MIITGFMLIVAAAILNAGGSLLLRASALHEQAGSLFDVIGFIKSHPLLLGGLFLFASNVLIYYAALKLLPVSVAYPLMVGCSFIAVFIGATFWLNEPLGILRILGALVIAVGIVIALSSAS